MNLIAGNELQNRPVNLYEGKGEPSRKNDLGLYNFFSQEMD